MNSEEEIKEAFEVLDADDNGIISAAELRHATSVSDADISRCKTLPSVVVPPRKLPGLKVRSAQPALLTDKSGTVTELLKLQAALLAEQAKISADVAARLPDDRWMSQPAAPEDEPDDEASGLYLKNTESVGPMADVLRHTAHHVSTVNDMLKQARQPHDRLLTNGNPEAIKQFPFAHLMYVAQMRQCVLRVERHLTTEASQATCNVSCEQNELCELEPRELEPHSRDSAFRVRSVWKTLHAVYRAQQMSLEGQCFRYLGFMILLLVMIAYFTGNVEQKYSMGGGIKEQLTDDFYEGIETFDTIANYENFWSWLQLGMLPVVFNDRRLIGGSNVPFGAIRIRQMRVKSDSCDVSSQYGLDSIVPCYAGSYVDSTKDTAPFGPDGRYTFQSNSDMSTAKSRYKEFGPEGYYIDIPLSGTLADAEATVTQMIEDEWLDTPTRAVVVELTALNTNVGLFAYLQMISEFQGAGNVYNVVRIRYCSIGHQLSEVAFYVIIIMFMFFFFFQSLEFVRKAWIIGLKFFLSFWKLIELVDKCLTLWFLWLLWSFVQSQETMTLDVTSSSFQSNLWEPCSIWLDSMNILSFLFMTCVARLLQYMQLEPRMRVLTDSVTSASKDICYFVIVWCVTTEGFAVSAYLLFGDHTVDYHRVDTASFTLIRMMLGELDTMTSLTDTHFWEANVYFFIFAVIVTIILLNLFIGIVSEFFSIEHQRAIKQEEESRRRGCLFPQFEVYPFTLLLRSYIAILAEEDASLVTRIRLLVLAMVGLGSPARGKAEPDSCCASWRGFVHVPSERTAQVWKHYRAMSYAQTLADQCGLKLEKVLWDYLEKSVVLKDHTGQAEFIQDHLEFFSVRSRDQNVEIATRLPDQLSVPELAYVLQYNLFHPDLRSGRDLKSGNDRVTHLPSCSSLLTCTSSKAKVAAAENDSEVKHGHDDDPNDDGTKSHMFRKAYVDMAVALSVAFDCQARIDEIDELTKHA